MRAALCGLVLLACLCSGCAKTAGQRTLRFSDDEPQKALRAALIAEGIHFEEQPDGSLTFATGDVRIERVISDVFQTYFSQHRAIFKELEKAQSVAARLRGAGVAPTVLKVSSEEFSVSWVYEDDQLAHDVLIKIDAEDREAFVERIGNRAAR